MTRPALSMLCVWLALSVALADEAEESVDEQDPKEPVLTERVEVRTNAPRVADVAAFATRIDTEEVTRRGQDLADVLRRVPGARVRDYGGLGSYATMSLRASTSEQVTVLVDGVPQNRALGGPVDLSSIPATQVEEVTVYRGFGPAAYGLGGMGGVVDVRTRAAGDKPRAQLDFVAGELGTARLSGDLTVRTGATDGLRVGLEWLRSDGDFYYLDSGETLFNRGDDTIRQRDNNDVEQASLMLRHVSRDLGGGDLSLGLRIQERERGLPGLGTFTSDSARLDESLQNLDAAWSLPLDGTIEEIDLQADVFRQEIRLGDPDGQIGLRSQLQTTEIAGAGGVALMRTRFGSHRALFRVDLRHERASVTDDARAQPDLGGAERDLVGVTMEDMFGSGRVTFAPSVRWQYRNDDFTAGSGGAVAPPAEDVSDHSWSGKLGVAWVVSPTASIRGSVGRFHRIPSLLELFGDRGSILGNTGLLPEIGWMAELGYVVNRQANAVGWSAEFVGFARRSENLIRFVSVSQGTAVARNLSRVESYGLEAAFSVRPARGLNIDASGTVQRAEDVSRGFSDGNRLPYQPGTLGYLGVAYGRGRLRTRWEVTYTGENSTDSLDTPELRLPARVIHDVNVELLAGSGFLVGIDLRNIFDRRTRDLLRHPLPGRTVFVHVGWQSDAERQ